MTLLDNAIATLRRQQDKGLANYGRTLDDAQSELTLEEMVEHLAQEQADGLMYAEALRQMVRDVRAEQAEVEALRAENARLKAALTPILELAQSLSVGTSAPVVPVGVPLPLPSPAAASLPQVSEIPDGCITTAEAQAIFGIGRSAFSNHKQAGRVVPAGKVRLKGGQWSDYYRREDIEKAAGAIKADQDARAHALEIKPVKAGPITVYNSSSLGQLLGISISGISFAVKAGRLTPREGTGTGSGNPYLFDIADPAAFKAAYEAKTQASRTASAQKAGQYYADQARQRREQSPAPAPAPAPKEEEVPLSPAFTPTHLQQDARRFQAHDVVPAKPAPLPQPKAVIPAPEIDLNEAGRYDAEEMGKRKHPGGFWLFRRVVAGVAAYDAHPGQFQHVSGGWEPIERFSKNGLGRWESCPTDPGAVGMHNGTTRPSAVMTIAPGGKP